MSLIVYKIRAIRCDIGDCDEEIEGPVGLPFAEVREIANNSGWQCGRPPNLDRCPQHSQKGAT
jgi:hypothetical protein